MKNKKGFTLVELLVSFALITAISLAFFRTILSLQQVQLKNIAKNNYKAFTIILNNSIQKDFLNDNIEKIISCGDSCYDITYTKNGIVRLSLDKEKKIITYGNVKEKLPAEYKFIGDIEFTSYINSYDGNDSYIALNINVKSNYKKSIDNIKYVYQYDSDNEIIELDVDGAEASDIIEYLLYKSPEENGLYEPLLPDGTSTGIRYRGENPNNYVYFNCEPTDGTNVYGTGNYDYTSSCEVWRMIGVFDIDNGKGNIEKRIKIIRDAFETKMSWDSSSSFGDTSVNDGYGINQWGANDSYEGADLMRLLNGYYIGKPNSECKYCSASYEGLCTNDCSNSVNQISTTSLNMVDDVLWNLGASSKTNTLSVSVMYEDERSAQNGKICSSGNDCNDEAVRTTTWLGKIGLIYPSDYGYASANERCSIDIYGSDSTCNEKNWLNPSSGYYLTISPFASSSYAYFVWVIRDSTRVGTGLASAGFNVRPSLYLKPNVTFIGDGNGTVESPYILGINE